VSFQPYSSATLHPGKIPCLPLDRRLVGHQSRSGSFEEEINLFALSGFVPRKVSACSQLSILTTLSWTIVMFSKRYSNPIIGLERPRGFQEDEAPRFQENHYMKVVRLSSLRTGRLYPLGNIPGTHFC